jgi:hypothetical protein
VGGAAQGASVAPGPYRVSRMFKNVKLGKKRKYKRKERKEKKRKEKERKE